MPLSTKDVLALRDKVLAEAKAHRQTLTPAEIVRGTRTMVKLALAEERPMPYLFPDPEPGKSDADFHQRGQDVIASNTSEEDKKKALAKIALEHRTYRSIRHLKAKAMVTPEDELEFQKVRPPFVGDAHHFVQWKHSKTLWEEADALCAAAGVK